MTPLQDRLIEVRQKLPNNCRLVAVSKYHPIEALQEAYDVGQRVFGESRVQEMLAKSESLPTDIEWHFIGHLQQNKVRQLVGQVSLIHAVDSLRLLKEIDRQAALRAEERKSRGLSPRVGVLLQLHVAAEDTKFGFSIEECEAVLAEGEWRKLTNVEIRGIMCMATNTDDTTRIADEFARAEEFFHNARAAYFADGLHRFDECSWGMSDDYTIALVHGSTLVRIGSYIFGPRIY